MNLLSMTAVLVLSAAMAANAETYRWTDSKGVMHFTDSYESIPAAYRHKVVKEEDITIRNPRIKEEVRQEEERARQEELSRPPRVPPRPEYKPQPPPLQVTPPKPTSYESPPPRTKSERVRENVKRREAEEKAQQPAKPGY